MQMTLPSYCHANKTKLAICTALLLSTYQAHADIQPLSATKTLSQQSLSVNGNAAGGALTIERNDPHAMTGGSITIGTALEYGDLDDIFDLFDQLSKDFKPDDGGNNGGNNGGNDEDKIDWEEIFKEYPELEGKLKVIEGQVASTVSLLALITAEGYAKADIDMEASFVLQDDFYGGTLVFGNDLKGFSKAVGIFEDIEFDKAQAEQELAKLVELSPTDPVQEFDLSGGIVLFYDPATQKAKLKVDNDSLLLVKTAIVNRLNLAYSKKAFSNDEGSLYWGVKPTFYYVGLTNVGVSIGDITDSEKVFDDIRDADYHYSSGFDIDLGLMWAAKNYQLGVSVNNLVESSYNFPKVDRSKFFSADIVSKLRKHEHFVMERQLKLEAAVYDDTRQWSLSMALDANKINDPMQDEHQWLSISGNYSTDSWWLPSARMGFSRNLAGSGLRYVNAGVTLFKYINLDVASTLNTVKVNDKELMRGLNVSLGVQFDY